MICTSFIFNYEPNLTMIDSNVKSPHEVVALEGMNHLFQHCQTGALTEYQQIEETMAVEVLEKMITFIIENTRGYAALPYFSLRNSA